MADDEALDKLFDQGRQAWPDIPLDRVAFTAFAGARLPTDGGELRAPDLYLACACAASDARALAVFEAEYISAIPGFLARTRPSAAFIDDVRQHVRERLFVDGKINAYLGRGALINWLRVLTVRVASNLRRGDRDHEALDDARLPAADLDPELAIIRQRYGAVFEDALRDAFAALSADERSMLTLHYVDGLNIDKIAVVYQVSRATIGRRILALRERILDGVHAVLRERLQVTPDELASLLRVVRSNIGLSFSMISPKLRGER